MKTRTKRGSNASPRRETVTLAAIRRRLAQQIGLRRDVQKALASSKRHYDQLLAKSGRMQEHLRRLSHEILSAHEEERKKISRELHDEIGQALTAVNVKLAALKLESSANASDLRKKLASTQRLVEQSMDTVHRFARELRPPLLDDLGLIPALRAYMKDFTRRTRIPIHFTAFAAIEKMEGDKRTVLFRVVQEALSNVDKHARAGSVNVSIVKVLRDVHLDIHDDGKSFHVERALFAMRIQRLGLIGMRERVEMVGGTFTIESAPGKGTTIRAQIPFDGGRRRTSSAPRRSKS
jgi:two-component system, NarL family, sensor histidine kinase DegS